MTTRATLHVTSITKHSPQMMAAKYSIKIVAKRFYVINISLPGGLDCIHRLRGSATDAT